MKKITFLLFLLIASSLSAQQVVLEDFEGTTDVSTNNGLGGANVIADPDDGSNKVLEIISASTGDAWQQADLVMQNNLMDLSSDITVNVKVKSTQTFTVMAKLDQGATIATAAQSYTGGSGWQTLTFTFNENLDGQGSADGEYKLISFFPNWAGGNSGTNTTNSDWNDPLDFTLYVDDVTAVAGASLGATGGGSGSGMVEVLEDFEGTTDVTTNNGLGGANVIADPDDGSNKVLEIISASTGDAWQQADLVMQNNLMDLSSDITVKVNVKSTQTFTMMAKLDEGATIATAAQSYTGGSGWQTLTFTFNENLDGQGSADGEYKKISFFPNWAGGNSGTNTTNSDWNNPLDFTLYVDDVTAVEGTSLVASSSQEVLESFEGTTDVTANNGLGSANVIADPDDGSNKVLEVISASTGDAWQQANLVMQNNFIDLSSDNTVNVKVKSTQTFTMMAKVDDGSTGAPSGAAQSYTGGSGWQTLTFTFDQVVDGLAVASGEYKKISFFPNWAGNNSGTNTTNSDWNDPLDFTLYIDDVTAVAGAAIGSSGGGGTPPTTAAPTPPTRNASDVVSLFSDAYTNIAINEWGPIWSDGAGSIKDVTVDGGAVKYIDLTASKEYGAVDFSAAKFDATSFTHMHIDIFVNNPPAGLTLGTKLSNHNGSAGETSAIENPAAPAITANGTWVSLDLDLSTFVAAAANGLTDRNAIAQIVIGAGRTDLNTSLELYFDNLYFYKAGTASVGNNELLNVSMYPNPTTSKLNISAQSTIKNAVIYNLIGKQVMSLNINKNSDSIDVSSLNSGIYIIKYTIDNSVGTAKFVKE